jgi:hypothetical protein
MKYQARSLKEALHNCIHRHPRLSVAAIAEAVGMSESYLYRAALPDQDTDGDNASGVRFPIKNLVPLIAITGDTGPLDYIEAAIGRVGVPLPDTGDGIDKITTAAIDASADFGAMMSSVRTSLADGIITAEEKELISEAAWRALRTIAAIAKWADEDPA